LSNNQDSVLVTGITFAQKLQLT